MYEELITGLRHCDSNASCKTCPYYDKDSLSRRCRSLYKEAADAIEDLDNRLNLYRQGKITRPATEKNKLPTSAKCEYYHADEQTAWHDVGVCYGTREKEHCEWGGDITQCGRLSDSERVSMAYRFERFGKAEQFNRWIPVTERLPKYGDWVLGIGTKRGYHVCEYRGITHFPYSGDSPWFSAKGRTLTITHWQPLPELPTEAEDG